MIKIKKEIQKDNKNVTKDELWKMSIRHIDNVYDSLQFFIAKMQEAAESHDWDKLAGIDMFHADFTTSFSSCEWWNRHKEIHRHHLAYTDGIPSDVNLLDIIEYIADCVTAGLARSGKVYPIEASDELLRKAFENTIKLLQDNISLES